jgi:hypothetical protein
MKNKRINQIITEENKEDESLEKEINNVLIQKRKDFKNLRYANSQIFKITEHNKIIDNKILQNSDSIDSSYQEDHTVQRYKILYAFYDQRKQDELLGFKTKIEMEKELFLRDLVSNMEISVKYCSNYTHEQYLNKNLINFPDLSAQGNRFKSSSFRETIKKEDVSVIEVEFKNVKFNNNEEDINTSYVETKKRIQTESLQQDTNMRHLSYLETDKIAKYIKGVKVAFKIIGSMGIGVGSGLATMPIVNYNIKQLEEFDIQVHEKEPLLITSDINTLLLLSVCNTLGTYKHFSNKKVIRNEPNIQLDHEPSRLDVLKEAFCDMGEVVSFIVTLQSVLMLWDIEMSNKKIAIDNSDFDEFTEWATFTTPFLMIHKLIENYGNYQRTIESIRNREIELDSPGAKAFIYSTAILSSVGRGIALTNTYDMIFKEMGVDEDTSQILSIIFGGVITNIAQGILEYGHIQSLFEKNVYNTSMSVKDKLLSIFSIIEGGWFALPTVAMGLNAISDTETLLKMLVFLPTFISRTAFEAHNIYDVFKTEEKKERAHYFDENIIQNNVQTLMGEDTIIINNSDYSGD